MRCHKLFLGFLLLGLIYTSYTQDDDFDEVDAGSDDDEPVIDVDEQEEAAEAVPKPVYKPPKITGNAFFEESFRYKEMPSRWVISKAKKEDTDEDIAKYDGKWEIEEPTDNPMEGDLGLVLKSRARHHAISAPLDRPYDFSGNPFVMQYEVKFQNGLDCGGAYVKLLRQDSKLDLANFVDKTPFTIMFGPDKCGNDNKLHFIFQHKNPKTGVYEEKHAKAPKKTITSQFTDKKSHLFTLIVNPDNSFEIFVDQDMVNSGNLLENFDPPVNPPAEIDEPNDKKPKDWDDKEKIPDPDATKPDDWDEDAPEYIPDDDAVKPDGWLDDESELIPDPSGERPDDWDDEMDGEWEAPKISNPECESAPGCGEWVRPKIRNPAYKGKWRAPMIDNPNYQGIWKPKRIANPDFFEDNEPYKMTPIVAVGLELWSMSDNIVFDNFIITDSKEVAESYAEQSWALKNQYEKAAASAKSGGGFVQSLIAITEERPWIWAVLLVVVVLPILLIIGYCCSSTKDGYISMLYNSGKERPWLFGVYLAVILLPVVAISIFLCPSKPSEVMEENDDAAERKKTDAATPDDEIDETDTAGDAAAGDAPAATKSKKSGKAALDAQEEQDDEGDVEEDQEEEKSTRKSPRKRKVRKD